MFQRGGEVVALSTFHLMVGDDLYSFWRYGFGASFVRGTQPWAVPDLESKGAESRAYNRALDDVLELAEVTWPIVVLQLPKLAENCSGID